MKFDNPELLENMNRKKLSMLDPKCSIMFSLFTNLQNPDILKENMATINFLLDNDLQGNSLDYFPVQFGSIDGTFYCSNIGLTTLIGGPQKIKGSFNASFNKLTSLEGGPIKVGGNYICISNQIASLKFSRAH